MFHYPRRVKDLPTLEPDSEDDFITPQKPRLYKKKRSHTDAADRQSGEEYHQENKENASLDINTTASNSNSAFSNMRMYPKRSSELPTLDSDSDDDENNKEDNLNCAILNDSFILSPCRSELDESSTSIQSSAVKTKKAEVSDNLSLVLNFDKMGLNSTKKETDNKSKMIPEENAPLEHSNQNIFQKSNMSLHCTLQPIEENNEPSPNSECNDEIPATNQKQSKGKILETPFSGANAEAHAGIVASSNIKNTQPEAQFATPQIRSFSVQRRPRDLCSTQSQKTRTAIVNEFRSQKVLFQTPMAISRAPMTRIPNDSISLSLCDTINEVGGTTPNTAENTPQCSEKKQKSPDKIDAGPSKFKKSLEVAFSEAKQSDDVETKNDKSEKSATATSTTDSNATESILKINNAEYIIQRKLGSGGSSSVYSAKHKSTNKECALKVVDLRGDPLVVEGYLNETKLLAKLQGNICVVALYDYQLLQKESKLFLVMEKGDSDLHKTLQSYSTNLPLYVLTNFLYQMLQAVNYIHQNGVIHSDLKPANFLMVNGRLKLIDFGIASNIAIDSTSIIKFSQAGTFNYISPEALTDTSTGTSPMRNNQPKIKISTKSDVWSLGCILYLFLYKKTPFSDIKNIYAKISAISNPVHAIEYPAIPPYYPSMLLHIAKSCLQHNPKKRPSCAELLQLPFNMLIPIHSLTIPTQQS